MKKIRHVLWDWNGTLLDDVDICVEILNGMLAGRGLEPISHERYREIFTFPIIEYYRRAGLVLTPESYSLLAENYMREYSKKAESAELARGAREVLGALSRAGIGQSIISASSSELLWKQVGERGIGHYFDRIIGLDDFLAAGKAHLAENWILDTGADPGEVLFIGDTLHDKETADSIGCRCYLVAGGHQSSARLAGALPWKHGGMREIPNALI